MIGNSPFDKYRRILAASLPDASIDDVEPESRLADLGMESVTLVQLVVQIEEAFDLNLTDDVLTEDTFESVESLWLVIEELMDGSEHNRQPPLHSAPLTRGSGPIHG